MSFSFPMKRGIGALYRRPAKLRVKHINIILLSKINTNSGQLSIERLK